MNTNLEVLINIDLTIIENDRKQNQKINNKIYLRLKKNVLKWVKLHTKHIQTYNHIDINDKLDYIIYFSNRVKLVNDRIDKLKKYYNELF